MNDTGVIRADSPMTIPNGRPWTSSEIATLRAMAAVGAKPIAETLERTVFSVQCQARRQGISLRPAGYRGGRLLGIPNGLSSVAEVAVLRRMRELVLSGEVDPSAVARYKRMILHGADLCPRCARNPVETTDGVCRPCQLRALSGGLDSAIDLQAAKRENDRGKAEKAPSEGRRMKNTPRRFRPKPPPEQADQERTPDKVEPYRPRRKWRERLSPIRQGHHLWAILRRDVWTRCPTCGRPFGKHELRGHSIRMVPDPRPNQGRGTVPPVLEEGPGEDATTEVGSVINAVIGTAIALPLVYLIFLGLLRLAEGEWVWAWPWQLWQDAIGRRPRP